MPAKSNTLAVVYPNGQVRVRRVQSTAYPEKPQLGFIQTLNDWYLHVRVMTDACYGATHALDTTIATEMLLLEAQELLTPPFKNF